MPRSLEATLCQPTYRGSTSGVSLRDPPHRRRPGRFAAAARSHRRPGRHRTPPAPGVRPVVAIRDARAARLQAAQEAEEAAETQRTTATASDKRKGKKKGKRKKKYSSFFDPKETLKLVAGVGALVAVLAFLAWGYPELRFPLGGFFCVIGFIVYALAPSRCTARRRRGHHQGAHVPFLPPVSVVVRLHPVAGREGFLCILPGRRDGHVTRRRDHQNFPRGSEGRSVPTRLEKMLKAKQAESPPPAPLRIADDRDD